MKRSFVGRERQLAALKGALDRAASGRGGFIRVLGEPGVGKTRLADELVDYAYGRSLAVGWARSWNGSPAFGLVIDLLRSALGAPEEIIDAAGSDRAGLGSLFSEMRSGATNRAASRDSTIEALVNLVRRLGPSLLVIDDLHGADLDSLTFLSRLAPQLRSSPTLLVATERSVATGASPQVEAHLGDLARLSDTLELEGLDTAAVATLMAEVTGQAANDRIAEAIHRATQGNALFVDGVLRAAVRDGSLEAGTLRFPRDVRQAILARVEAVGEDAIRVLQGAALLTRAFSTPLLGELVGLAGERVLAVVERAVDENLLIRDQGGRFAFRHQLVAEALAATLPPLDRASLHAKVAELLDRMAGAGASERAYHLHQAASAIGHEAPALACRLAARQAAAVCAHEEAASWLARARDLIEVHAAGDRPGQVEIGLDLGRQLLLAGRRADARRALLSAAQAAETLGDVQALGEVALATAETGEFGAFDREKLGLLEKALTLVPGSEPLRVRLAARLAAELWVDPDSSDRRKALSAEAVALARQLRDPALLRAALDARFQSLWGPSSLDERIAIAEELGVLAQHDVEEALAAHRRRLLVAVETGDMATFSTTLDSYATMAASLKRPALDETIAQRRFLLAMVRGEIDAAASLCEEILERSLQVQNPQAKMGYRFLRSELLTRAGNHRDLAPLVPELASDADRLPNLPFIRARTAQLAALAGDSASARAHLERYVASIRQRPGEDISTLAGLAFAAEAASRLRATDVCRSLHERLSPYARIVASIGSTLCVGSVSHFLGLLERELGQLDAAVTSLEAALECHRAMPSPPLERETSAALAATLRLRGRPGDIGRAGLLDSNGLEPASASGRPEPSQEISAGLAPVPGGWQLTWRARTCTLGQAKGLQLIAHLVQSQGRSQHVLDLVGAGELRSASGQDDGPTLDARAKEAYRTRLAVLREAEDEADDRGDGRAATRARIEREAIEDELARSVGLGGRARSSGTVERARVAVAKSVRRALDVIARSEPECAAHLERSLRMGIECTYTPDPASRVKWCSGGGVTM